MAALRVEDDLMAEVERAYQHALATGEVTVSPFRSHTRPERRSLFPDGADLPLFTQAPLPSRLSPV